MEVTFFDKLPYPLIEKINSYLELGDKYKLYDIYYQDLKILRKRIVVVETVRCYFCFKESQTFLYDHNRCCVECIFKIQNLKQKPSSYHSILSCCSEKEKVSRYLLENSKVRLINGYYNSKSVKLKLNKKLTNTVDVFVDWEKPYIALKRYKNNFLCLGELMRLTHLTRKQVLSHFKVEKIRPTLKNYSLLFHSHYFLFNRKKILKYIKENID